LHEKTVMSNSPEVKKVFMPKIGATHESLNVAKNVNLQNKIRKELLMYDHSLEHALTNQEDQTNLLETRIKTLHESQNANEK